MATEVTRKEKEDLTLRRMLGLAGASSMVAGIMIGSGIFVSARWVMVYSGSVGLSLLIWLLCAVVAFVGGLCWVELGLTFPKCGGEYMIINETLGAVPAFAIVWLKLLFVYPSSTAITALTFASYAIEPFFPGCGKRDDLLPLHKILATFSICVIALLNILSGKMAARVQIVFTGGKILALVMIIITGFVRLAQGHTDSFENSFQGTTSQIGVIGLAFQSGLWAYEGWDVLNDVTEEVKNPVRNMPRAVLGSITTVTCCYMLVNVAYLAVLTPQELKDSPATAVSFANRMYGSMEWIIPLCVACSVFGSANAGAFTSGRVIFAAAREGHLPIFLAMIHTTKRTPIPSLLFQSIVACILLIPDASTIKILISLFSFAEWFTYTITVTGLLWTRYRRPEIPRPFKLPLIIPILFLMISLYLAFSPVAKAPLESLYSLLMLLAGIPVYYFFIHFKLTPKCIHKILDRFTYKLQQLLGVMYPKSASEIVG